MSHSIKEHPLGRLIEKTSFKRTKSYSVADLGMLAGDGLVDHAGTQATRTDDQRAYHAVGKLMPHLLQIGIEAALGLDIGMADKVADLRFFTAEIAFFAHDLPPYIEKALEFHIR